MKRFLLSLVLLLLAAPGLFACNFGVASFGFASPCFSTVAFVPTVTTFIAPVTTVAIAQTPAVIQQAAPAVTAAATAVAPAAIQQVAPAPVVTQAIVGTPILATTTFVTPAVISPVCSSFVSGFGFSPFLGVSNVGFFGHSVGFRGSFFGGSRGHVIRQRSVTRIR